MDADQYLTNPTQAPVSPTAMPVSQPTPQPTAVSQVNGPFKTHGIAGDILGHVMDMVLVGAGLNPEYTPRLERAKLADAERVDPTVDPTGAASNLYSKGYQREAQSVLTNASESALRQAQAMHAQAETKSENLKGAIAAILAPFQQQKAITDAKESVRQLAGTVNPNNVAGIHAQALKTYTDLGLDPSDLPAEDDIQGWKDYNLAGVSPSAKYTADNTEKYRASRLSQIDRSLDQTDEKIAQGQARTDAAVAKSNRGPATKAPTVNNLIAGAIQRRQQGKAPLPGDDDLINKGTHVGSKKSVLDGLRNSGTPTQNSGKTVIQNGHRFDAVSHKYLGPA